MTPLESLNEFLGNAEGWLWTWAGMPVVIVLGLYFTIRSKGVQFRMIPAMFGAIAQKAQREEVDDGAKGEGRTQRTKSLSAFQAFSIPPQRVRAPGTSPAWPGRSSSAARARCCGCG